jgi:NitT/TauT family transport system substrate-binding protein
MNATLLRISLPVLLLAALVIPADSAGNSPLRFSPHWLPQAQFAGFYVAQDQGFYREAGLDVEITHPRANVNVADMLKEGTVDVISQFLVSAIVARDQGLELVNFAQSSQHSAILFVSKSSSGIENIGDFQGKKIGVWQGGFSEVPMAMIRGYDLAVEWVPILSTVNLFLMDGVDLMTVMWYNEYNQIYLSGINEDEMNTFFLSDHGFDVPEDGLYAMKDTRVGRSADLKAFVEATQRGWDHAAENRDYTLELVLGIMRQAHIPANAAHQRWMLDRVLDMQESGDKEVTRWQLHPNDFHMAVSILKDTGMIQGEALPFMDFFQPVVPADE